MSGVGAGDQVLDVEFLPESGVEGANACVKFLAKRSELIDITVELLRDAMLIRSGNVFAFATASSSVFVGI